MPPRVLCNRCNAEKQSNGPCPKCGSPEERRQYSEIEDLEGEIERQRALVDSFS